MDTTQLRTLSDRIGAIERQLRALTRDPTEWDALQLHLLLDLGVEVVATLDRAVLACRDNGITDVEIAAALGTTRQAVSKRWPGGGRYVGAAGRYRSGPRDADDPA